MKYYPYLLLCILCALGCTTEVGAQVIFTAAGMGAIGYHGDNGQATNALLYDPGALAIDNVGNLYISDVENNVVRKVNIQTGIITTVAGNGSLGSGGDGGPATAAGLQLNWGITFDAAGNLIIADQENHRVRKVDASGTINTIAGIPAIGYAGDGGPATLAKMNNPLGLAADHTGNLYIVDQQNWVVRIVNSAGIINRFAGTPHDPDSTGDGGQATSAKFSDMFGLATDAAGNVYICDAGNHRIRKVSPSGIVTTVAGTGAIGYSGDNGPATGAKLNFPTSVYPDGFGNLYIADCRNNVIRFVNSAGIISTIAGTGVAGYSGDGGRALTARFDNPVYVTGDQNHNLYISDFNNQRIRVIRRALMFKNGPSQNIHVCQDQSIAIDTFLAVKDLDSGTTDTWSVAMAPAHGIPTILYSTVSNRNYLVPAGLTYKPDAGYFGNDSFKVRIFNGFDADTMTIYVSVDPTLSYGGVINGPSYVCVGDSITLTDTTGNGIWSVTNLNATVSNGVVKGESPGLDTVKYSIKNACGTISSLKPIVVYAPPYAGVITGQKELCIGIPAGLSDTASNGIWSVKNSVAGITTSGVITGNMPGVDTVYYSVSDAFCTGKSSTTVTVDPYPTASISGNDTALCIGSSITISGDPGNGTWLLSNNTLSLDNGTVTAILTGTDTISYIVSNFCGTDTASIIIIADPVPGVPDISQSESTLFVSDTYAYYQWMKNGAAIAGAKSDSFKIGAPGLYAIEVRNSYGCPAQSAEALYTDCTPDGIVVYPNPAQAAVYVKWCKKLTIRLVTEDGRAVAVVADTDHVDLNGLPNGAYLIEVFDENGHKVKSKKVTKWVK